jgi:hypothetical protein
MISSYFQKRIIFDLPFQKSSQRWRPAERGTGSVLPQAIVSNLMGRDITNDDYDMLLQLDK